MKSSRAMCLSLFFCNFAIMKKGLVLEGGALRGLFSAVTIKSLRTTGVIAACDRS